MSRTHQLPRLFRTIHLYLGVFSAPMLLFFAVTGGLQTFSLHETTRGSSYAPPAWLASMAQLHKKQTLVVSRKALRPAPAQAEPPQASVASVPAPLRGPESEKKAIKNLLPMKMFFSLISLGLFVSVLSGLYMAWRFTRKPLVFAGVLAGGIVAPLLLLSI